MQGPSEGRILYSVEFISGTYNFTIDKDLTFDQAIRLVNFLNGGPGWDMNEPVIGKYEIPT